MGKRLAPIPHWSSCVPGLSQAHPGIVDRVGPSYVEAQGPRGLDSLGVTLLLALTVSLATSAAAQPPQRAGVHRPHALPRARLVRSKAAVRE